VQHTPPPPLRTYDDQVGGRADADTLDPMRLWLMIRRRWPLLGAILVLCLAAGAVFTLTQTPLYRATSTVMIDQRTQEVVKGDQVLSNLQQAASGQKSDVVDTEVEVLRSPRIAETVARTLRLDQNPAFNGTAVPTGFKALARDIKRLFRKPAPQGRTPADLMQAAVQSVEAGVSVQRRGLTNVIDIQSTAEDPRLAAQIANTYAAAYLSSQVADKVAATESANAWLAQRVEEMRGEVTSAERNLAQYQAQQGLLVATGSQLNEQRVAQLQLDEGQARTDLAEKMARLSTARKQLAAGATGEELGQALSSPVIQALRGQIAQAQQKQADLLTRYGPKHPDVINSQHDIAQAKAQIREEIGRIIGSLESDVTVAQSRLSTIQGSLSAARGTLAGDKTAQVQGNELDRNAQAKRGLYQSYLDRLQQTSTQTGLARADASLVANAQAPRRPASPNLKFNMLVSALAAASIGAALVTLLELLNQGLQTSTQVEQKLGQMAAGSIPLLGKRDGPPQDLLVAKPFSVFAEAFRKLRVFVQHGPDPVKVIALTSALPKEGKTTTAFCFARSLGLAGLKVLVVDCDLRMRSLSHLIGAEAAPGLLDVLSGAATLQATVRRDPVSHADILPAGAAAHMRQRDFLGSEAMDTLILHLKDRYDFVILDCPPALAVSDALTVAHKADGVLFLVRSGTTPSQAAEFALHALHTAGANVLGVALTLVDMEVQARYGYGDGAYFLNRYREYYNN
jgi:succinoglycan biosynthesis transport protein ExoP